MSVPLSDPRFGHSFIEVVVILESLEQITFDDKIREKTRLSTINYLTSKLWWVYPIECEGYYNKGTTQGFDRLPPAGD